MNPEPHHNTASNTDDNVDNGVNHSLAPLRYASPITNLQPQPSTVSCPCVNGECAWHEAMTMAAVTAATEAVRAAMEAANLDSLPIGYRFIPTDEELITHYLWKKINNENLPKSKISEADIYENHPKDVVGNYPQAIEDGWYFFTPRSRKYPNGDRPDRQAGSGYWKATGPDKIIKENDKNIGRRKSLVYYEGHAPHWTKTKWMMHEYVIEGYARKRSNSKDNKLDDYVLCKIYINGKMKEEVNVTDQQQQPPPRVGASNDLNEHHMTNVRVKNEQPLVQQPREAANDLNENHTTNVIVKNEQALVPDQPAQHSHMVSYQVQNNVVVQNYQNMTSPYDLMLPYSISNNSSPARFNHDYSYVAPTPQQPLIPSSCNEYAPRGQVREVMYRSGPTSNPPQPQVAPPFQEGNDYDTASLLRQSIERTYALEGNDDFLGENYLLSFDGNEHMDVDEWKKHI